MEGDVDGVMEMPTAGSGLAPDELQKERDKWDAWNSQKGLTRTESKRRYVEALIETMHKYANTSDGRELVAELEFVWNQIKDNAASSDSSSANPSDPSHVFHQPRSGSDGPMKILSPMSEQDIALRSRREIDEDDEDAVARNEEERQISLQNSRWTRKMERAITKLTAEVAALREQIATGREWKSKKEKSFPSWMRWLIFVVMKHLLMDCVVLCIILVWMRSRKDRRLEDIVRAALRLVREYVKKILPSR
ncbi:hypothetical protein ACHAPX_000768 [Trichoderma viride]